MVSLAGLIFSFSAATAMVCPSIVSSGSSQTIETAIASKTVPIGINVTVPTSVSQGTPATSQNPHGLTYVMGHQAGDQSANDLDLNGALLNSYTVSGLGNRKQEVLNAGASTLQLAIAMLETDHMQPTPNADNKVADAANWGIFNQNWYMLRTTTTEFNGMSEFDWRRGARLNYDLGEDIKALTDSMNYAGQDLWFRGQRDGQTGYTTRDTSDDIETYKRAVLKIQQWLEAGHLEDDLRAICEVRHV